MSDGEASGDGTTTDGTAGLEDTEMQHMASLGPDHSRTYRAMRWLMEHLMGVILALGFGAFVASSFLDFDIPRWTRIVGLTTVITFFVVGRPTASKVRALLWDPRYIWLVDLDARTTDGGIYRMPAQRFREWSVVEGQLDWATPDLAFGKDVDLREQTVRGCWRGTLSDRELMRSLQAVEECRGQLEDDAKRGFAIETQAFAIVRNATRKAVLRIVSTFERGTLPDEGQAITEEIDAAIEQFDLERKIRETEVDESPESDVPGIRVDLDGAMNGAGDRADHAAADGGSTHD